MDSFFRYEDYQAYLSLIAGWCRKRNMAVWASCLMPNLCTLSQHRNRNGLHLAIGDAHWRYSAMINRRRERTGRLGQARFSSFPMDEKYLLAAVKYIEMNPVRAGLVADPP